MPTPPTYLSFIVRLWRENIPPHMSNIADWEGEIEHIQSGRRWRFHSLAELMAFFQNVNLAVDDGDPQEG